MTDIPIALDNSQLLHNNSTSTHQHHQLNHSKHQQLKQLDQSDQATNQQQVQQQKQQQPVQPFPNLEAKKNGLVYMKSSNNVSNGTKSATGLSRTTSNTGTNSPLDSKSSPSASTTTTTNATLTMNSSSSVVGRKRSNSQSQVISIPAKPKYSNSVTRDQSKSSLATTSNSLGAVSSSATGSLLPKSSHGPSPLNPRKRNHIQYYVTLLPLNDTFIKKHLPVATYPETTKLGRPTGTKHKPDVTNGYFDSRVLSRNHAQIYIDPKNGKLMLQDLGSSNGTYLNDVRLNNDPTEVKMGDVVCLGFNVQAESTHKQISLKIENINVISTQLENGAGNGGDGSSLYGKGLGSPEFRHISFIEDICNQVEKKNKPGQDADHHIIPKHQLSYENYLFNDVNTELDDYLLGLYSNSNTGIYHNSRIGSPSCVESIVGVLLMNLSRVKQQNLVLQELFKDYENFKNISVDQHKKLDSLDKKLKASEEEKSHLNHLLTDLKSKNNDFNQEKDLNEKEAKHQLDHISSLERRVRQLEEEKEKYERAQQEQEQERLEKKQKEEEEEEEARAIAAAKAKEAVKAAEMDELVRQQQELNNFIADLSRTPSYKNAKIKPEPIQCDVEPFPTVEEHSHSKTISDHNHSPLSTTFSASSSSSSSPQTKESSKSSKKKSNLHKHGKKNQDKLLKIAQVNSQHLQTFTIAMSAMIIGYFFKKLTE